MEGHNACYTITQGKVFTSSSFLYSVALLHYTDSALHVCNKIVRLKLVVIALYLYRVITYHVLLCTHLSMVNYNIRFTHTNIKTKKKECMCDAYTLLYASAYIMFFGVFHICVLYAVTERCCNLHALHVTLRSNP